MSKTFLRPIWERKDCFCIRSKSDAGAKAETSLLTRLLLNIRAQLHSNRKAYCSTLFDYYGLPTDFPGKYESKTKNILSDISETFNASFENALKNDIRENSMRRFIPYVQMHEFEGILFSDPSAMAVGIGRPELRSEFTKIRDAFETPEHINDSQVSAPSKRIANLVSGYQKPLMGETAAKAIGLTVIRRECPLFNDWLTKLENLPTLSA